MAAVQSGAPRHRCLQRADNPGGIAPRMFLQFLDQGFQKPHTVLWFGAVTAYCSETPTGREALLLALLSNPWQMPAQLNSNTEARTGWSG